MTDLHELDVRINAAGESATAMNQSRGRRGEARRGPRGVPARSSCRSPSTVLRLAAIQAWSEAAKAAQRAPTLAPGLVVADVNGADDPIGHGGVSPSLCTPGKLVVLPAVQPRRALG
jgi:hypothetical protein